MTKFYFSPDWVLSEGPHPHSPETPFLAGYVQSRVIQAATSPASRLTLCLSNETRGP